MQYSPKISNTMEHPLNLVIINKICLEHFEDLFQGHLNWIYVQHSFKTLSGLRGEPISHNEAKHLLSKWIEQSLQKGNVFLYVCRDNFEIAIEDPESISPEDRDLFEQKDNLPLYIGYD